MMNRGKDTSPLFEIINKSPRQKQRAIRLPEWMRRALEMENHVEAAEPTVGISGARQSRIMRWLGKPIGFRLQRGLLLAMAGAMVLLVVVTFLIGMAYQNQHQQIPYQAVVKELQGVQNAPANYGVIPGNVERATPIPDHVTPPPSTAGAKGNSDDPREPGLNYYRLVELPGSAREEGDKAVAFLQQNGIDAAMISVNNDRSYKLLVLKGFSRLGAEDARSFEEQLKKLGRLWKAKYRGSSDWHDLYAEKYIPGRT